MIRLKDIAARAGVSVMTVSKVMRGAGDISTATRTRVRKLAEEMGYVPDSMARSLRYRSSRLFGLLIASTTNPIFARMVMAIEEHAHALEYDILFGHTLNDVAREEHYIRRFISRRIDGLFITPVYRMEQEAAAYRELQRHNIPVVLLGQRAAFCEQFQSVQVDVAAACQAGVRHLVELGHKRIAFLAGSQVSPATHQKLEGYRRGLQEAGIEFDDGLVFQGGSTVEEGQAAALQILDESPGFTAIQAANDLVAIGAASTFLDQGLRIPRDFSIVGFGNVLTTEHFRVPLTTIRQPKFRLGSAAVELMTKLINKEAVESRVLSAEIVVRESTGKPPKKMIGSQA